MKNIIEEIKSMPKTQEEANVLVERMHVKMRAILTYYIYGMIIFCIIFLLCTPFMKGDLFWNIVPIGVNLIFFSYLGYRVYRYNKAL